MKDVLLQLKNASVHFGGVKALDDVSISIDEGEMVALMGPNGAGKSTLLKAVFGLVTLDRGTVIWHGTALVPVPHKFVELGVVFVPQGRRVFASLTLEENLEMGAYLLRDTDEKKRRLREVYELLPVLYRKRREKSVTLSGGEQQMLALARGLMMDPRVLLLDEPTLGLAPKVVSEVFMKIREINERHRTAILIVEHNIQSLLQIVSRGYVLDKGKAAFCGSAREITESGILDKVFLGA